MSNVNTSIFRYPTLAATLVASGSCLAGQTNGSSLTLNSNHALLALSALGVTLIALLAASYRKQHKLTKKIQHSEVINQQNQITFETTNKQLIDEVHRHNITEALLRETQDYLHSIINSMPSMVIGVTVDANITHWNKVAEQQSGISAAQALGKPLTDIFPPASLEKKHIQKIIDDGEAFTNENYQHQDGDKTRYFDITIYPLSTGKVNGAVIRVDDITFRVHVENRLIQNEKMVSLGELAAGMAHEINNPLSAVIQSTQNLQRRISTQLPANQQTADQLDITLNEVVAYLEARQIPQFINSIRESGERAATIVTNMLEFARFNHREHNLVDLPALINNTVKLAANSFQLEEIHFQDIKLSLNLSDADFPKVHCSGIEIQQVILNILRNASQAVAHPKHRANAAISISLQATSENIIIRIKDNGAGMSDTVSRHIFEPFYTTKDVGQGTGLGLSVSYFIITERHNGSIDTVSALGKGTEFSITLPLTNSPTLG